MTRLLTLTNWQQDLRTTEMKKPTHDPILGKSIFLHDP